MAYFWVIPLLSAVWVGFDASRLGFKRGRLGGGTLDMGVTSYVLPTLLIWVIGFPCYMVARTRYVERKDRYRVATQPLAPLSPHLSAAAAYGADTAAAPYAAQTAPPQYSPDGQWWWTGQTWVPANTGAAPPG